MPVVGLEVRVFAGEHKCRYFVFIKIWTPKPQIQVPLQFLFGGNRDGNAVPKFANFVDTKDCLESKFPYAFQ